MKLINPEHFLPDQRPGSWQPDMPIDCLHALRLRFPGCLNDRLLCLQLINSAWPESIEWGFRLVDLNGEKVIPFQAIADAYGDGYDYSDWKPEEFPSGLLNDIRAPSRLQALQDTLGIFKIDSFEFLHRITADAADAAEKVILATTKSEISELTRQADFFRCVAKELAEHISNQVDLFKSTVRHLKYVSSETHSESAFWLELGAQAYEQSVPAHELHFSIARQVYKTFKQLNSTERMAVCFNAAADSQFPGGNELQTWDTPSGPREDWKDWGVNDLCENIGREIIGLADEDHWQREEGSN